jgi:prephenate dehydratase
VTADGKRRLFLVGAADEPDALVRVLNVVTALQARLRRLEAEPTDGGLSIRFEIDDPGDHRAEALARRLEACPAVTQLAFGWRGGLAPARMSPN